MDEHIQAKVEAHASNRRASAPPPLRVSAVPDTTPPSRAEFLCAVIVKENANSKLGLRLEPSRDGKHLLVAKVQKSGRFGPSCLQVGDVVVKVNHEKVSGGNAASVFQTLRQQVGRLTIVAYNPEGARGMVETTVDRPNNAQLSLGLGVSENVDGLEVSKAQGLFSDTLVKAGDSVLSVNDVQCEQLDETTVSDMIHGPTPVVKLQTKSAQGSEAYAGLRTRTQPSSQRLRPATAVAAAALATAAPQDAGAPEDMGPDRLEEPVAVATTAAAPMVVAVAKPVGASDGRDVDATSQDYDESSAAQDIDSFRESSENRRYPPREQSGMFPRSFLQSRRNLWICCAVVTLLVVVTVIVVVVVLVIEDSPAPTEQPSVQPSPSPTAFPSLVPSSPPSGQPSLRPSLRPSSQPSPVPAKTFESTIELQGAIDDYLLDPNNQNSFVAQTYGWPIGTWDVSLVTDFSRAFDGGPEFARNALATTFNDDISGWNTSSATDMNAMFEAAASFNGDISGWDTSRVTDFEGMFNSATSFSGDLSRWNTSSATNMRSMFNEASSFTSDISGWDTSKVTDMSFLFSQAIFFSSDLSRWDTSKVRTMQNMFTFLAGFDSDLSDWDVSSVTSFSQTFFGASSFQSNLSSWDTRNVRSMRSMFNDASNFDSDLSGWFVDRVTDFRFMFREADAFASSDLSGWNVANAQNMTGMFSGAGLFSSDLSQWNVGRCQGFHQTFFGNEAFNADLSAWDTSSALDFTGMFEGCIAFNSDVSNWTVSSVTDMGEMFQRASAFNADISGWDVSSVTNFDFFLEGATVFDQDLCAWSGRLPNAFIGGTASMFSGTACPDTRSPSFLTTPPGPFCHPCDSIIGVPIDVPIP